MSTKKLNTKINMSIMATSHGRASKTTNLENIWQDLNKGIDQIYKNEGMQKRRYMELYTYPFHELEIRKLLNSILKTTGMKIDKTPSRDITRYYIKMGCDLLVCLEHILRNRKLFLTAELVEIF